MIPCTPWQLRKVVRHGLAEEFQQDTAVHVWFGPIAPPAQTRLSPAEALRQNRIAQECLHTILDSYLETGGSRDRILRREQGKPYLPGGPEFNLSHTSGALVIAVSHWPVGVDVEWARRRVDWEGLSRKFLDVEERGWVAGGSDPGREFLRVWTRKEAAAKLEGRGIYRLMRQIRLCPGRDAGVVRVGESEGFVQELGWRGEWVVSLAQWVRRDAKFFEIPQDLITSI